MTGLVLCEAQTLFVDVLADQLEVRGHRILATLSSPEDLPYAVASTRADVVMLGMDFPGACGIQAARGLRAEGFAGRIVLCSGSSAARLTASGRPARTALRDGTVDAMVDGSLDLATVESVLVGRPPRWSDQDSRSAVCRLTPREVHVLALLAEGLSTHRVAAELGVSASTVQAHLRSAMRRLGVNSRVAAVHALLVARGDRRLLTQSAGHGRG